MLSSIDMDIAKSLACLDSAASLAFGAFMSLQIFSAQSAEFPGSKRYPLYPSFTASGMARLSAPTTGAPHAIASSMARP